MKISEIIHTLADPLSEVMKIYGKGNIPVDFPSRTIAFSIYSYNKKTVTDNDILNKNNPFGFVDPSTGKSLEFNSIKDAIVFFKQSPLESEEFEEKYQGIAKANNLFRFDKDNLYSEPGNIVDVQDAEPSVDQYTVSDSSGKEVLKTSDLKEAKAMSELNIGSKVYNSRGIVMNGKEKTESSAIKRVDIKAGSKIICNNLNLYYSVTDKRPGRSITGEYYIYDGKKIKNRYAVCVKNGSSENPVYMQIGYINAKDIEV